MTVFRRIVLLAGITGTLIFLGRTLPRFFPPSPEWMPPQYIAPPDADGTAGKKAGTAQADSAPGSAAGSGETGDWQEEFHAALLERLRVGPDYLLRREEAWDLVVPRGKPLHEYALEVEELCRRKGIEVLKGRELRAGSEAEFLLRRGDRELRLRLRLGSAYLPGAARLAVVFTGFDSLTAGGLDSLERLPWKKTLVVNPHAEHLDLEKLRASPPHHEILLELPMEPFAYPYLDPGPHALYIHHSQEEVERLIQEALDRLPDARGFASKYGDRAIEHEPLLRKLFDHLARRDLLFLDLTGSPRSLAREVSIPLGANSRPASTREALDLLETDFNRRVIAAQKTGEAVLAVRHSPAAVLKLDRLYREQRDRLTRQGVALVTLSELPE